MYLVFAVGKLGVPIVAGRAYARACVWEGKGASNRRRRRQGWYIENARRIRTGMDQTVRLDDAGTERVASLQHHSWHWYTVYCSSTVCIAHSWSANMSIQHETMLHRHLRGRDSHRVQAPVFSVSYRLATQSTARRNGVGGGGKGPIKRNPYSSKSILHA